MGYPITTPTCLRLMNSKRCLALPSLASPACHTHIAVILLVLSGWFLTLYMILSHWTISSSSLCRSHFSFASSFQHLHIHPQFMSLSLTSPFAPEQRAHPSIRVISWERKLNAFAFVMSCASPHAVYGRQHDVPQTMTLPRLKA